MSMHRMFVYGTLKRGEPNYELLTDERNGRATFVGVAKTVDKWPLVIASEFNVPFLLHAQGKGKEIYGEIFDVDDSMLAALDILEGHPTLYERVQRQVDVIEDDVGQCVRPSTDSRQSCWIYFLHKFKPEMLGLPFLDEYSSQGRHGLVYAKHDDLQDPEDI